MGPPTSPAPGDELRDRAHRLAILADRIEAASVMRLTESFVARAVEGTRSTLCARLLDANLHQLHAAADDLRLVAFRLRSRADNGDGIAA